MGCGPEDRTMTNIVIRTVGNPSLYQSLRDSIASETHHRTVSGALRRLEQIERQSRCWVEAMGNWGGVEIEVNGAPLDRDDTGMLDILVADYMRDESDDYARRRAEEILSGETT
jgi:hypothetical protein